MLINGVSIIGRLNVITGPDKYSILTDFVHLLRNLPLPKHSPIPTPDGKFRRKADKIGRQHPDDQFYVLVTCD